MKGRVKSFLPKILLRIYKIVWVQLYPLSLIFVIEMDFIPHVNCRCHHIGMASRNVNKTQRLVERAAWMAIHHFNNKGDFTALFTSERLRDLVADKVEELLEKHAQK